MLHQGVTWVSPVDLFRQPHSSSCELVLECGHKHAEQDRLHLLEVIAGRLRRVAPSREVLLSVARPPVATDVCVLL